MDNKHIFFMEMGVSLDLIEVGRYNPAAFMFGVECDSLEVANCS
ncbi:MAG: hypothetical protein Q7U57_18455 [Methylovulum sp.]|nr:hypothetical protein [Methylovulum sp.]